MREELAGAKEGRAMADAMADSRAAQITELKVGATAAMPERLLACLGVLGCGRGIHGCFKYAASVVWLVEDAGFAMLSVLIVLT